MNNGAPGVLCCPEACVGQPRSDVYAFFEPGRSGLKPRPDLPERGQGDRSRSFSPSFSDIVISRDAPDAGGVVSEKINVNQGVDRVIGALCQSAMDAPDGVVVGRYNVGENSSLVPAGDGMDVFDLLLCVRKPEKPTDPFKMETLVWAGREACSRLTEIGLVNPALRPDAPSRFFVQRFAPRAQK